MTAGGGLTTPANPVASRASLAVLVAAVAASPWITTPMSMRSMHALSAALLLGVALWLVGLVQAPRRPQVSLPLCAFVCFVLAYGWDMTLNGHPAPAVDDRLLAYGHLIPWLPGAIDRRIAFEAMVPLTAVLLTGLVLIDHCRRRGARTLLLAAIATSAATMSVVAIIDRLTEWSWPFDRATGGTRFVAFGYHGNAAGYLELALPAALLLTFGALSSRHSRVWGPLSIALPVAILVGCAVNVSKLGQVLAFVIVLGFSAIVWSDRRTDTRRAGRLLLVVASVTFVVISVGAFAARDRWEELPQGVGRDSGRALVWEVAGRSWPRSPIFGSGPGGFKILLPSVTAEEVPDLYRHWIVTPYRDGEPILIWSHAHNDPLQTLVEWGPFAGIGLVAIALWPLGTALSVIRRPRVRSVAPAVAALALGVLYAHALVDFPLQVFSIQLTAAAWGAVAISGSIERRTAEHRSLTTVSSFT